MTVYCVLITDEGVFGDESEFGTTYVFTNEDWFVDTEDVFGVLSNYKPVTTGVVTADVVVSCTLVAGDVVAEVQTPQESLQYLFM